MRKDERQAVIQTAATHALEFARKKIWLPRCKEVEEALGPREIRNGQNRTASPGQASHDQVRTRSAGRRPPPSWGDINKRAFDTEAHMKMVAPEWTD